jgi:hypothetical protein
MRRLRYKADWDRNGLLYLLGTDLGAVLIAMLSEGQRVLPLRKKSVEVCVQGFTSSSRFLLEICDDPS